MKQCNSLLAMATLALALALALLLPGAPAEASEVVKLARLVITGKRLSSVDPVRGSTAVVPLGPHSQNEARPGSDDMLGAVDGARQFRPI